MIRQGICGLTEGRLLYPRFRLLELKKVLYRINSPLAIVVDTVSESLRFGSDLVQNADISTDNFLNVIRLLVSNGADPMMEDERGATVLHKFYGPAEPFSWLIQQDFFAIDLNHRSHDGATVSMTWLRNTWSCYTDWTRQGENILLIPLRPADVENKPSRFGTTTLHYAILAFCVTYSRDEPLDKIRAVLVQLIRWGADVHAEGFDACGPTLLDWLLQTCCVDFPSLDKCYFCRWKENKKPPLKQWLDVLSEAGISLPEYFRREQSYQQLRDLRRPGSYYSDLHYRTLEIDEQSDEKLRVVDHWVGERHCICFDELGHRRSVEELAKIENRGQEEEDIEVQVQVPGGWDCS